VDLNFFRQLRNRDAAVRSRERKKMYVGDLEMKSRYLEAECRRLGRLLQCCYAENQALRLSLQSGNAFGAPMTKQESAVLLLGMDLKPSCPCFFVFFFLLFFFSPSLSYILLLILLQPYEKYGTTIGIRACITA
jgi:hypothetical protein